MYVAMETLSSGDRVSLSRYLNRALLIMLMMLFLWGRRADYTVWLARESSGGQSTCLEWILRQRK